MIRRTNRRTDIARILELDKVFFADAVPPHPKTVWWVAEQNGDLAGYAGARLTWDHTLYLERAAVRSWARGQGLQKRLIRVRLRWGRANGAQLACTYTIDNPKSANSLIACGFRVYKPAEPWVDGDDVTYWQRTL